MNRRLAKLIPTFLKSPVKKIYWPMLDVLDRLRGSDSMIPPRSMVFVGNGDFLKTGNEFLKYFIDLGRLQPHEKVLDVGCGIGRMAIPLTGYLSPDGEYVGFDIVRSGIDWCQQRITPRFPNFRFLHSDIFNKEYNPQSRVLAKDYRFPFDDQHFDFAFLTSVFTHMLPGDLENYLKELARVLKPGGRCLITYFVLNDESRALLSKGETSIRFRHEVEGCLTTNQEVPEAAIAYDEPVIRGLYAKYRLEIESPIRFGSWCKRPQPLSFQDIILARKL